MNRILIALITLVLLTGCKNDFDLIEDGSSFPVAFGFINLSDTAQYVRVERAFAVEGENAIELAKQEDQVYYDDVYVALTNLRTNNTFPMERVDANAEGYVREPGDFLTDPNYVYKVRTEDTDLLGGDQVQLTIIPNETGDPSVGVTSAIDSIDLLFPNDNKPLNLAATQTQIQYRTSNVTGIVGIKYILYVREALASDPTIVDTVQAVWTISDNLPMDTTISVNTLRIESKGFYQTLANQLDKDKDVIRRFDRLDVEVTYGGLELLEFRRIALANGGLSGSLELPQYTNIDNARGIFSSKRDLKLEGLLVDTRTRDSLANGQITGDLNFQF